MQQHSATLIKAKKIFILFFAFTIPLGECSATIPDLLTLPEDKIDVGIVALTLAKEIYPEINIATYSDKIDALAEKVRQLARGTQNPDQRIRCLNTVLFLYEKFQAERDSSIQREPPNYYLNHLLDTKRGNCFSMPLLYIAIAQRLGWPVYFVHVPDHSFVRYIDLNFNEQNIEATSGGGFVSDEKYAKDFFVSETGRKKGIYLRTLTYREFIGELVSINAITHGQQGHLQKAITYLELATKFNPRLAEAWANLANVNKIMGKRSNESEAIKYFERADKYSKKIEKLGFVHPKNVPQFTSTRRLK